MSRSRYKLYESIYPYFITSSFVLGLPLFSKPEIAKIVLNAFKYHRKKNNLRIYACCLMENHFHLIAEHTELNKCMQSIKSYSAKQILDFLRKKNNKFYLSQLRFSKKRWKNESYYQVWQEGYHPKQVSFKNTLEQKVKYIHFNPVQRGYVDKPEDWRYSSARNYMGINGLIEVSRVII